MSISCIICRHRLAISHGLCADCAQAVAEISFTLEQGG